ncbi:MAG: ribosome silencing factor [Eubacterium sp.]|nr:ribosome silencing factor [Eubacterium sp.]
MNSKEFAEAVKGWIEAKNGTDIDVIDISEVSSLGDYFVIASGSSERQVKAIADNIEYEADKLGIAVKNIEGAREARWILMDYYDVIIHIFHAQEREFYNLERLWKDGIRPSEEA